MFFRNLAHANRTVLINNKKVSYTKQNNGIRSQNIMEKLTNLLVQIIMWKNDVLNQQQQCQYLG